MGILLRVSLALSLLMAAVWFGGNLVWLWIIGVGLPAGDPDVALQAASAIEATTGGAFFAALAALSLIAFIASAVLSWGDQRGSATKLLVGCVIGQGVILGILFGLPVEAQNASSWGDYGVSETAVTALSVIASGIVLTLVGLAIWSAARSRFMTEV